MSCYLAQFLDEWSYYFVLVFNLHWSCCTISSNKGLRSNTPSTPSFSMMTGRFLTTPALNLLFYTAMFSRAESNSPSTWWLPMHLCLRYCCSGSELSSSGRTIRTITSFLLLSTLPKLKYYKIKIYQLTFLKERILYIFLEDCSPPEIFLERWIFIENTKSFSMKTSIKRREKDRKCPMIVGLIDIGFW